MKLLQKYGEDGAKKFFPIIASDYDSKIISVAQKGYLPMYDGEDDLINMGAALLARCVPMAAGFNPFKFITNGTYTDKPYLYGETPNIEDLYNRGGN